MPRPTKVLDHAISYHVRVNQVEGVTDESIISWLQSLECSYLVCREEADAEVKNTHYHIKLECPYERTKIVSQLTTTFPACKNVKGGTQHHNCVMTKNEDDMVKYICKGLPTGEPPIIIGYYGIQYAQGLEHLYGKWWSDKKEFIKKVKDQKRTMREQIDEAVCELPADPLKITRAIVNVYLDNDKALNTFHVEGLVKLYMAKKSPLFKAQLCESIANKCTLEYINIYQEDKVGPEEIDI